MACTILEYFGVLGKLQTNVSWWLRAPAGLPRGLDLLMGSAAADCMSFRYVDARPWSEVSALTGYSERQSMRLCEQGLDAADFLGMANCVGGEGVAT